eukprot:CAMPEP_0185787838 /NCGR_PEP_ID=MMETSP1174-20130828/143028_1 /TAXON_ID=35687 /ORGANISM="Dictyocha speculum, Strain CCMP1381" /LENGTH=54 /DNA_ID=CAMNT_0028481211 /DNA_START=46 /DNA_END=210 /DNA_ORIENTATION=-
MVVDRCPALQASGSGSSLWHESGPLMTLMGRLAMICIMSSLQCLRALGWKARSG